jgi:hypothetical protein
MESQPRSSGVAGFSPLRQPCDLSYSGQTPLALLVRFRSGKANQGLLFMAMHAEGVGLGTGTVLHPPLCQSCHKRMELKVAVPHPRYTNLDMCQFRCECGSAVSARIARNQR